MIKQLFVGKRFHDLGPHRLVPQLVFVDAAQSVPRGRGELVGLYEFVGVVFANRVEEMSDGGVALLVVGVALQVVENQQGIVGLGKFFGYFLRHLVLHFKVGEEGAFRRVPKFVDDSIFAVSLSFCAEGTTHAMVEKVNIARHFRGAVGDQLVLDLQHVDGSGDVEKLGMIDGELVLLFVHRELKA